MFFSSPYEGQIEENDQRRLKLPYPVSLDGHVPDGFIGHAVNMIDIETCAVDIRTAEGYGLRETLFYNLFGELQVYDTREHMKEASACIKHGAISLDGGIFKQKGMLSLGFRYLFHSSMVSLKKTVHFCNRANIRI